ncbi:MAG: hypothetical protein O7B29_15320, partial [Deltaproteobacteria bacterium]|nr:hypothetical protein [Deltaproteobacteria bacterium]
MSNGRMWVETVLELGAGKVMLLVAVAACAVLALPAPAQATTCVCEGGIVVIKLRAGLPYSGGTISVEARAAKRGSLITDPYGVDTESFDGSLFTSGSFSRAVAITRIAFNGTEAVVTIKVDATRIGKNKLDSNAVFRVTFDGATSAEVEIHTSCSLPIGPPFEFGGFRLLGFTDFAGPNVCQPDASDLECGDGSVESNEECNDPGTPGCSALCEIVEGCGDGVLQPELGEGCDDGGTANGDGCDSDCHVEAGYACGGPIACESAWHLGDTGAASCFFEGSLCPGCGPINEALELCTNTCVSSTSCDDPQRTIFAGGPLT